jgi:hypothetical protein
MCGCRLTGLEAIRLFGSIKLSNRISEIEKFYGVTVKRNPKKIRTRFGEKRVMEYFISQGI